MLPGVSLPVNCNGTDTVVYSITMVAKREMSDDHKAALALGRQQGRAVRDYLDALEKHRPKRGRKRTPESIAARLDKIAAQLDDVDPVTRLQLVQERLDLEAELAAIDDKPDLEALEAAFVDAAPGYSERKGISYAAWRESGVEARVLKAAGISRRR